MQVEGSPLCVNCVSREGEIYLAKLADVNAHQQVFSQLWTECQHCQVRQPFSLSLPLFLAYLPTYLDTYCASHLLLLSFESISDRQ